MKKLVIGLMAASLITVGAAAMAEDKKEKDGKVAAKTAEDAATTAIDSTPEGAIAEGVLKDTGATKAMEKGADELGKDLKPHKSKKTEERDKKKKKEEEKKEAAEKASQ